MLNKIEALRKQIEESTSSVKTVQELQERKVEFLGKKGKITELLKGLRDVAPENRKEMGAIINKFKSEVDALFTNKKIDLETKALEEKLKNSKKIDITLPINKKEGSLHPITIVQKEVEDVFASMGFIVEDGNEIETEYNNFEAVNVPKDHPARDMQDTFWLENGQVLKTQTSAAQNRILKTYGKELEKGNQLKVIFPGRCFRNESMDASHENTFFQLEGMLVGEDVSVSNLIYFMKKMLSEVLKTDLEVRLRPGYFPFVEPGFELDINCLFCGGKGCSTCGGTGWIELCPCGMIHPKVLEMGGVDNKKYRGFAFGLGLTRLAMIKYGLKEIRTLNSGNIKFLKQTKTR